MININEQDNNVERVNRMAQNSAMSLLRWAKNKGWGLLKLALKKIVPAILSYLAPIAIPVIATLLAFILIYVAIFMLPRWIMGGGSGPISQNTVGVLQVNVTGYTIETTATGVAPTNGVVAVDPSVIAYGTRMYIPGYGNGIALDDNPIKGNNIAVYFSDVQTAKSYGSQPETIELLGMGAIPTTTSGITTDTSSTGSLDALSFGNTDTTWPLSKDQALFKTYLGLDSSWLNAYESSVQLSDSTPDSSSGNASSPSKTTGNIWGGWTSQIPSESDQAYPYRVPWSMMAAMDKIAGEQNFIATNVPGSAGDGRVPDPNKHFKELSPTLQWKTFQLYYEHDWTAVVDDGKGGTTLKSYSEEYTKNIRLLTSAACYDASYQYQWGQQVMERTSDTPGGGHDHSKVIIPQVTLLTRTGPYYQKLKTILSQPEYGLTSEMDMQMVIQCAQSLDQAYMIDSWLFGTPLEMSMDSENGTGLTSRFKFMPVNDAPVAVPYGMSYNQELNKLTMNPGVDLMADYGASVFSVADGTVVFTGAYGSDGNAIMINNGNCRTLYADLSITSVSVGQQVKAGQEIGKVGMPYLHFEVRTGNDMTEYLNPANYLPAMIWGTGSQVYVSPKALQYQAVNANVIIAFLQGKGSALANATAVNDIISGAQSHDINPLLLFAITGAEQSFDPVNGDTPSDVIMIADNPFNVGGTWQNGGYTLAQSADVCANFLAERLSQAPPSGTSAIEWINDPSNTSGGLYACGADGTPSPSWVPNVTGFFNMINGLAGVYSGTP